MPAIKLRVFLFFGLTCGITVAAAETPKPAPKVLVWVGHTFIGGPKCVHSGPVTNFEPPGFASEKAKLLRAGVTPEREYFRDLATCEACHKCANYHREILFEIPLEQLEGADKAGYRKVAPPTNEELNEYEQGKGLRASVSAGKK